MDDWKSLLDTAIEISGNPALDGSELIKRNRDDSAINLILNGIKTSRNELPIGRLFPGGVPTNDQFFERLFRLRTVLGFGQTEGEIVAALASEAVGTMTEEERLLIFRCIADQDTKYLNLHLEIFPQLIKEHAWPLALLSQILLDASDKPYQGHNGYDRALRGIAEAKPELAYDLICHFIHTNRGQRTFDLAQYLLGLIRLHNHTGEISQKFSQLENELRGSSHQVERVVYMRSQVASAWTRGLAPEMLQYLQSAYCSNEAEEQTVVFEITYSG